MSLRDRIRDSVVMRWFLDYLSYLVFIAIALAVAVALDVFKHRCEAWRLSQWLIDGMDDLAKFVFSCDQFLICSIVTVGTLVTIVEYVLKRLSRL